MPNLSTSDQRDRFRGAGVGVEFDGGGTGALAVSYKFVFVVYFDVSVANTLVGTFVEMFLCKCLAGACETKHAA